MSHIVAIGGGRLTGPDSIRPIHQEIVRLSTKPKPHVLFIPTASSDDRDYTTRMETEFISLGCTFTTLNLIIEKPSQKVIASMITIADIIYVGGGNTLKMMTLWRRLEVAIATST